MRKAAAIFVLILFLILPGRLFAALSFTLTDSAGDNVDRTSYAVPVTGSFTPVSGSLYYLFIWGGKATTPDIPTVTGTNGWNATWTNEASVTFATIASPTKRLTAFSGVASSSTAGVFTVDFAGTTQLGIAWSLIQVTGNAASGYTVQVKTGNANNPTSLTVTLDSAFADANNQNLSGIGFNDARTVAPGTDFTELSDITVTVPSGGLETNNKLNDTSCDWTWTGGGSHVGAISIEVAVAAAPGGCTGSRLALMGVGGC